MTKSHYFFALIIMLTCFFITDLKMAKAPDIFNAPSLFAWGSGELSTGAHCSDL